VHHRDEGGDGPQAVGEDDRADDGNKDGEDPLYVSDGQDVPVAHRAEKHATARITFLELQAPWATGYSRAGKATAAGERQRAASSVRQNGVERCLWGEWKKT
jgi:hypothetical protein